MNAQDPRASSLDALTSPKTDPQARPAHPAVAARLATRPTPGRPRFSRATAWRSAWSVA